MNTVIAALKLEGRAEARGRFELTVEIGTPYPCGAREWACPIAVRPLYETLPDVHGEDSFQALCLAIATVQDLLDSFRREGGELLLDGEPFPLEAYSFGLGTHPLERSAH